MKQKQGNGKPPCQGNNNNNKQEVKRQQHECLQYA